MRKNKDRLKEYALIFDIYIKKEGEAIEILTVDKILGYYQKIIKMSNDIENKQNTYLEISKLIGNTACDLIKCKHTAIQFDWIKIISKIRDKLNIIYNVNLQTKYDALHDQIKDKNFKSKEEYKIYAKNIKRVTI